MNDIKLSMNSGEASKNTARGPDIKNILKLT